MNDTQRFPSTRPLNTTLGTSTSFSATSATSSLASIDATVSSLLNSGRQDLQAVTSKLRLAAARGGDTQKLKIELVGNNPSSGNSKQEGSNTTLLRMNVTPPRNSNASSPKNDSFSDSTTSKHLTSVSQNGTINNKSFSSTPTVRAAEALAASRAAIIESATKRQQESPLPGSSTSRPEVQAAPYEVGTDGAVILSNVPVKKNTRTVGKMDVGAFFSLLRRHVPVGKLQSLLTNLAAFNNGKIDVNVLMTAAATSLRPTAAELRAARLQPAKFDLLEAFRAYIDADGKNNKI
jgi:hypothetical protein